MGIFDRQDIRNAMRSNPWIIDIAARWQREETTWEDIERVVEDFICDIWLMSKEEVNTAHVAEILAVVNVCRMEGVEEMSQQKEYQRMVSF